VRRAAELNEVVRFDQLNMAYFATCPRCPTGIARPGESGSDFGEANLGLTREQALAEAKRCFNCGVCNDCELCLIYCPDVAIKRTRAGTASRCRTSTARAAGCASRSVRAAP